MHHHLDMILWGAVLVEPANAGTPSAIDKEDEQIIYRVKNNMGYWRNLINQIGEN